MITTRKNLIKMFAGLVLITMAGRIGAQVQVDNPIVTQDREIKPFNELRHKCSAVITLSQGQENRAFVEAPKRMINRLQTAVSENKLIIFTLGSIVSTDVFKADLTIKKVRRIELTGMGELKTAHTFTQDSLIIAGDFYGNAVMDLDVKHLVVDVRGGATLILSGKADQVTITSESDKAVDASQLETRECEVISKGTGDISVHPVDNLHVILQGPGNVYYKGTPESIKEDITGTGALKKTP
ncbi:MAG: DUF2807 domain-containing protein [Bacteroidales bacterium]|nr:DUF2807 domain-containing protein [Bacteroidales bacterium]